VPSKVRGKKGGAEEKTEGCFGKFSDSTDKQKKRGWEDGDEGQKRKGIQTLRTSADGGR